MKDDKTTKRRRIGFVVKNGRPVCGSGGFSSHGVGPRTIKIVSLGQAKANAKRIGGEWLEVKKIIGVDDRGFEFSYFAGIDWGTK